VKIMSNETRDKGGYYQYREDCGRWLFCVVGFNTFGREGFCRVLKADKTSDYNVPINEQGQIRINGRWYGHRHWNH